MSQLCNDKIVKILIDTFIFLEFSDDEVINEDASIQLMEQISSDLQCMDDENKNYLAMKIKEMSIFYDEDKQMVEDIEKDIQKYVNISLESINSLKANKELLDTTVLVQ